MCVFLSQNKARVILSRAREHQFRGPRLVCVPLLCKKNESEKGGVGHAAPISVVGLIHPGGGGEALGWLDGVAAALVVRSFLFCFSRFSLRLTPLIGRNEGAQKYLVI